MTMDDALAVSPPENPSASPPTKPVKKHDIPYQTPERPQVSLYLDQETVEEGLLREARKQLPWLPSAYRSEEYALSVSDVERDISGGYWVLVEVEKKPDEDGEE